MREVKMLRFSFWIAIILSFGLASTIEIECNFETIDLPFIGTDYNVISGQAYTCTLITEINLQVTITKVVGTHEGILQNIDVKVLIVNATPFAIFPTNLKDFFPSLEGIYIKETNLGILQNSNLKPFESNLKYLTVTQTDLKVLEEDLLKDLSNLNYVDFSDNQIIYFSKTSFNGPSSLKILNLLDIPCSSGYFYEKNLINNILTFLTGLQIATDVCFSPSNLQNTFNEVYLKYIEEKNNAERNMNNLKICQADLNFCENPVTIKTTAEPQTTTESSKPETTPTTSENSESTTSNLSCDCSTTSTTPDTTSSLPSDQTTISTSTDISTIIPPDNECETQIQLLIIEKNKYLNFTEVCVAQRDDLKEEVEELYKEIEDLTPSNFTCRFKISDNVYECVASKIVIKSTATLTEQKILWVGKHVDVNTNVDVKKLIIKSQSTQLLPLEVGKAFENLETFIVESSEVQKLKKNNFVTLEKLTKLSIIENEISSIESGTFDVLTKLTNLNLRGNKIATFPVKAFEKLTSLTHLDLGDNKLTQFKYDMIASTNSIKYFYADLNTRLISVDILLVWRLSKAELIDLSGTSCNLKFNVTLQPSFKTFFNEIVGKCA